jgi:transposase
MSRPPVFPAEDKIRIVLSVLAGEMTIAEAARRNKVSETSIGKWKQQFLEAGKLGLATGGLLAAVVAGAGAAGRG